MHTLNEWIKLPQECCAISGIIVAFLPHWSFISWLSGLPHVSWLDWEIFFLPTGIGIQCIIPSSSWSLWWFLPTFSWSWVYSLSTLKRSATNLVRTVLRSCLLCRHRCRSLWLLGLRCPVPNTDFRSFRGLGLDRLPNHHRWLTISKIACSTSTIHSAKQVLALEICLAETVIHVIGTRSSSKYYH